MDENGFIGREMNFARSVRVSKRKITQSQRWKQQKSRQDLENRLLLIQKFTQKHRPIPKP